MDCRLLGLLFDLLDLGLAGWKGRTMSGPTIIEASDIACASAAADLFGGNGLNTNQQVALVANLFAEHRAKVEAERDEARDWVRKLQRTVQTVTCVYCGHEYPPNTPTSGVETLTAHIRVCEKHPMHALRTALLDVMDTERLRDLAHQKWQSAQEDDRLICHDDYVAARDQNSSACAAHHDALNKARALLATP